MKSVFYTCVTGPNNGYVPDIRDIRLADFDYVVLHDSHHEEFPGWDAINIDRWFTLDTALYGHKQRFGKALPHRFFPEYDYYVYLDPKWDITGKFLLQCRELLNRDSDWMMCRHPDRETLIAEILFPYCNGTLSFEEIQHLVTVLKQENVDFSRFFATLGTWILRRNTETAQRIGERWFELICKCYKNHVRDQIVLPFAVSDPDAINRELTIADLYDTGVELNYPNQVRTREVDWASRHAELTAFLKGALQNN